MPETRRETFAATWTLAGVLLLGVSAFLIPLSMSLIPEVQTVLTPHNQTAESLAFVLTFFVFLPLTIWLVPRYASRFGADALTGLATGLAFSFGLAIALIRISHHLPWGNGIAFAAIVLGVWLLLAAALLAGGNRPAIGNRLEALGRHRGLAWAAALAGGYLAVFSLVAWRHLEPEVFVAGVVAGLAAVYLFDRLRDRSLPALGRRWGLAVDAVVFLLVLLAVPDMVIFPIGPGIDDPSPYINYVVQFHQNLFLGPASQVLDGQVLLVDSVSQYGIGSIYLISAFFEIAPIGHGTLGFLDGFLSAVVIACGYLILRMSGVRRILAIPAMAVAVVVLAWGLTYPIGGLLQHGAIRYGLPILLIAALVAGSRWPRSSRPMRFVGLFVVALSSVWALEAFLYTLAAWVGLVALETVWAGRRAWRPVLVRRIVETVAAMVAIHVLFALGTLVASGDLPDWSLYLKYLKEFVTGDIGDLTYDYAPWSRGLGVGAFYLVAVIGLSLTLWKRVEYTRENRTAFVALTGSLAYGIALYSYFVNRSLDHVLPYLLLPFILVVVISLGLAFRAGSPIPRRAAGAALLSAMLVSALAIAAVAPGIPDRASTSMLAYAVPGGKSLRGGFQRLWNPPPLVAGADEAERLLETEMPGEDRSAVITASDLSVEALARAGRANSLGFSDPKENSWVPEPNQPIIDKAIAQLEPGDLMLIDQGALDVLATLKRDPGVNEMLLGARYSLVPLQVDALRKISDRFRFETVTEGGYGLRVVRLQPR